MDITVRLLKPAKDRVITYQGELVERTTTMLVLRAVWSERMGRVDAGPVVFEPGDVLYEYFYSDRWYNIFALHTADGRLKGWYCNLTRPAVISDASVESEDLELDLFITPDRQRTHLLDAEEYKAWGLPKRDPAAHNAVQAALTELHAQALQGVSPFDTGGAPR
ncbi:MAG: DUF402 domain-containing protein [Chloroflexaceae bacterium]|nr:DUF402 domain-containing protein [Chloroflexaceae bacterium]